MSRMTDQIGRVLGGRYRLIAPVGTGASAQVYLADDARLRRRVAVKVLHAALADDDSFLRRFRAEAQAAAALSHPHVLAVYDWGDDEVPYLVTEYLGGGSLRAMLDRGTLLSPSQALLVGLEASRALDYAHRRGFVHRDIKPANLLFGEDQRLRIADFGLARALAEAAWTEPQGAVLGTARYASPEQAKGEPVDGKGDVYSLALVLVEAVTGRVPFSADTTIGTLMARVDRPLEVPAELSSLRRPLERAGRPDPVERPDASELVVALMASAEDLPRPAPLPLAGAIVYDDAPVDERDPTVLAPSTIATPDETVAVAAVDPTMARPSPAPVPLDPDDGRGDRRRRRWPIVLLASVLAVAIGVGSAFAWVNARTPSYEVPELIGKTEAQARTAVGGFGWRIVRREVRRDNTSPGHVVDTDPAAHESLKEGETLVLYVSLGNELTNVPRNLVGMTRDKAVAALRSAQLEPTVVEAYDEEKQPGIVIATRPAKLPARLAKQSEVTLVVSKGPAPRTVPVVAGKTYEQAKKLLEQAGLKAKKVEQFSDDVAKGKVIATDPAANAEVPKGTTVKVAVSKGPDLVVVPDVKGMELDEAVETLRDAGLTPGDASGPADGKAFTTFPTAGTKVKRGTVVDIYLRR